MTAKEWAKRAVEKYGLEEALRLVGSLLMKWPEDKFWATAQGYIKKHQSVQ